MLFSSPDYPIFLIAVFFLYALARWGGARFAWARIAVMVLLGDLVFMLVAKDTGALWDPLGGILLRAVAPPSAGGAWSTLSVREIVVQYPIGLAVLGGALWAGRRRAAWIASARGQSLIARGIVVVLGAVAI